MTQNNFQFYVLDMQTGTFIAHADRPRVDGWYVSYTEVEWKDGQAVARVEWDYEGKLQKSETITLRWKPD